MISSCSIDPWKLVLLLERDSVVAVVIRESDFPDVTNLYLSQIPSIGCSPDIHSGFVLITPWLLTF